MKLCKLNTVKKEVIKKLTGAIQLPNMVSNPLFQVIILFIATTGTWFLATDETIEIKKKILSFASDVLYYFILTSFGLNLILNFKEIISEPYRFLLLSSDIYWMAMVGVMIYLTMQAHRKSSSNIEPQELLIDQTLNYFFLLGLFNHLFYYYKYRSINSVIFILVYFLFYLFKDRINHPSKNEITLLILALLHAIVMNSFSKIIIYYQIVFYPYQIVSLLIIASAILYFIRRDVSSKQI